MPCAVVFWYVCILLLLLCRFDYMPYFSKNMKPTVWFYRVDILWSRLLVIIEPSIIPPCHLVDYNGTKRLTKPHAFTLSNMMFSELHDFHYNPGSKVVTGRVHYTDNIPASMYVLLHETWVSVR